MDAMKPLIVVSILGSLAAARIAAADTPEPGAEPPPPPKPPPSLTLKAGQVQLALTLEMNMSKGAVFKPFSIAPDISYGVTSDLTIALVHSTAGTTGFRGTAGDGICVTGTGDGCKTPYNNVGGELVYALQKGEMAIAAVGGVYSLNLDESFVDLKIGARTKYTAGKFALLFTPSVFVGMNRRDAMVKNADQLYLPVGVTYKLVPAFALGLGTGVKGPLANFSGFGDTYLIPLGINGVYTAGKIGVGASFTLAKPWGGDVVDATTGTGVDFRAVHVWLTYSS